MGCEHLPHPWESIPTTSSSMCIWRGKKMQLFAAISAPPLALCFCGSMCVVAGHKSMSWELYPAWGRNGEVRMQGWNFPLESCKMQTPRLPNSCTERQRAKIHLLQRTSHQGIQVQYLPLGKQRKRRKKIKVIVLPGDGHFSRQNMNQM